LFNAVFWDPLQKYDWHYPQPLIIDSTDQSVSIYEAHVGMAQEDEKVSSYREFALKNLDRIIEAGYNII
jgi:1,4-alpha-glucan branching enzyme